MGPSASAPPPRSYRLSSLAVEMAWQEALHVSLLALALEKAQVGEGGTCFTCFT